MGPGGAGGGHDDDVVAQLVVLGDEVHRLRVDVRVDELVHRLRDDLLHLADVPPSRERRQVGAHPLGLVGVRAADHEQEVGVGAAQDVAAREEPATLEGLGEGRGGAGRDDRLVEVEEGRDATTGVGLRLLLAHEARA